MKIYDISQELLSCEVYPGDPKPKLKILSSISAGDAYNLTSLDICLHNGTHIDAPAHFIDGGKTVDELPPDIFCGTAYIARPKQLFADDAAEILDRARAANADERILIGGDVTVSLAAARVFAEGGVKLVGVESQSVGPADAPAEVHRVLLSRETVLLEGLRLCGISEGVYTLFAPPLSVRGAEGAPCRALLFEAEN